MSQLLAPLNSHCRCDHRSITPISIPSGWHITNPSIAIMDDGYLITAKVINYDTLSIIQSGGAWESSDGDRMRAMNMMFLCDSRLCVLNQLLINETSARSQYELLRGWTEDYRLVLLNNKILVLGLGLSDCIYNLDNHWHFINAKTRQFLAVIGAHSSLQIKYLFDNSHFGSNEKNYVFVPPTSTCPLRIIRDINYNTVFEVESFNTSHDWKINDATVMKDLSRTSPGNLNWTGPWSGGTPAIRFNKGFLCVLHRRIVHPKLHYSHKFVFLEPGSLTILHESQEFYFEKYGIEFACGLCWDHNSRNLIISYGVDDKYCRAVRLCSEDVSLLLGPISTTC